MKLKHWAYTIPLRLRSLFHRNRLVADLDEELRDHIDRQIEYNLTHGMREEEARLAALRAFGNPTLEREKPSLHGDGTISISSYATCALAYARCFGRQALLRLQFLSWR